MQYMFEKKEKAKRNKTSKLVKDKNTTKCGEEVQVKNIKTNKRKEISSKEGGKSQTDKQEPRKSKRVSKKPKHDGFVDNFSSEEEETSNVRPQKNPWKQVSFAVNDGQTPENNAALKRQQKNKKELAAKFKELGIPLINSENTGAEEEEDISSDFDRFD